ncbi:MAG TPA: hypothetical protein VM144_05190 [Aestuariivirga sp.]|nr:hypothetical protein [Aestuariivirga sp.]
MHERKWQFRLDDDNVIDCASYFEKRASEVAEAMNCRVVASNVVSIENLRGNVRKIIGTALLENAEVQAIPKPRQRLSNLFCGGG